MRVVIGSDASGMPLKEIIKEYLLQNNFEVVDKSESPANDFVDSTLAVTSDLLNNENSLGLLFDAYGAGSFMTAAKVKDIIVAEVSDERSAYMTRGHNNARVITLGTEIVGNGLAKAIVSEFLAGSYEGGRHQVRVDMLNKMA